MPNPEVKILLKAVDEASRNIAKINKGLKEMEGVGVKTAAGLKKTDEQLKAIQDTSFKLAAGFGAVAAAGGLLLGSSVKLAARIETLGVVTVRLGENVGMTEKEIRSLEEAIQDQGITTQASRQMVAKMIQTQIDLSHATDIARLAQDAAVIANINSSEAAERVTNIIATGSVIMARRIGLTVDFMGAYEDLAETLGKTADDLTDLERIQARTAEVMEAGTRIVGAYDAAMETAGKKVLSLDRHLEESSRMLGEVWLPVYADAIDLVTDSLKTWENLDQSQKDATSTALGYVTAIAAVEAGMFLMIGTGIKLVGVYKTLVAGQAAISLAGAGVLASVALVTAGVTALGLAMWHADQQLDDLADSMSVAEKEARESGITYENYKKGMDKLAKSLDLVIDEQGRLVKLTRTGLGGRLIDDTFLLTDAEWELARSIEASDRAMLIRAGLIESDYVPAFQAATDEIKGLTAEELNLNIQLGLASRGAEAQGLVISELTDAAERGEGWFDKYAEAIDATGQAAKTAQAKTKSFLDGIDRSIASPIENFIKDLEWMMATGGRFETAFEAIKTALDTGKITPEEAKAFAGELYVGIQDVQVDLDELNAWDAAKNITDTLGGSLVDAKAQIDGTESIMSALTRLTSTIWELDVIVNYRGGFPGFTPPTLPSYTLPLPPPDPGDVGYIPPGDIPPPPIGPPGPGDVGYIPPGEGVPPPPSPHSITPGFSGTSQTAGGGVTTIINNIEQNNYTQGAAAVAMAEIDRLTARRLNGFMGG